MTGILVGDTLPPLIAPPAKKPLLRSLEGSGEELGEGEGEEGCCEKKQAQSVAQGLRQGEEWNENAAREKACGTDGWECIHERLSLCSLPGRRY
jgi:hypothetical protein